MKIIKGFSNYAVSADGNVYNIETGRKLKPIKRNGYLHVGLYTGEKEKLFSIHRLVADAYLPNEKRLPCVNHKDENKENNSVENLEWCDCKYNNHYGQNKPVNNLLKGHIKLQKGVYMFSKDGRLIAEYCSAREAARQNGINQSNITKCCKKKVGSAGGYIWTYYTE